MVENDLANLIRTLEANREKRCFPGRLRVTAAEIAEGLLSLLFPHFSLHREGEEANLGEELSQVRQHLISFRQSIMDDYPEEGRDVVDEFLMRLSELHDLLMEDALNINAGDPASSSVDEVILAYPGFYAIATYRLAHALHKVGYPLLPRLLTEFAHSKTGVDIHPCAQIGRKFYIDHGTGVVIGETAVIGENVRIYQGVTLGALIVDKDLAGKKRHPTLKDNVVVYANATILGGATVIGKGSVIGGNVWLTNSVPASAVVTHRPEVKIRAPGEEMPLDYQI